MKSSLKFVCKNENSAHKEAVVLLHGFGASMHDLLDLADMMDPEKKKSWYFPQGPFEIPLGPAMVGFAWFPIRLADFESFRSSDGVQEGVFEVPQGYQDSMSKLKEFVAEVSKKHEVIAFGGFSQGAMMSYELVLSLCDPKISKLVMLSGALLSHAKLTHQVQKIKDTMYPLDIFQSHGLYDEVLTIERSRSLRSLLKELKTSYKVVEFPGGHEIPAGVVKELKIFLDV
jgi:phospholipase/carboxylesterase